MTESRELKEEMGMLDRILESQMDQLDKLIRTQEEKLAAMKKELRTLRGIHELRKKKQASICKVNGTLLTPEGMTASK